MPSFIIPFTFFNVINCLHDNCRGVLVSWQGLVNNASLREYCPLCDESSGQICWSFYVSIHENFLFFDEMFFRTVSTTYSRSVAIFLLTTLLSSIKQWWRPNFNPFNLRLKPNTSITAMVTGVKVTSRFGVLNFCNCNNILFLVGKSIFIQGINIIFY